MADGGTMGPAAGRHLIAGEWVGGEGTFRSSPWTGEGRDFAVGSPALVDRAVKAAEAAFPVYAALSREQRATFLERIAEEIEARGEAITEVGHLETGLPRARLEGERGRTTGQLRLFAQHIRKGEYLDRRHDAALPDRKPLPRPDMKLMQLPIGPVAVFGASNFPLAFSVAGGDTASALAAGCPVVVKGHSAHPGTGEVVAEAVLAAIEALGVPAGVFSLVQGGDRKTGEALVQHPLIRAVGFTGVADRGAGAVQPVRATARPDPVLRRARLGQSDVRAAPGAGGAGKPGRGGVGGVADHGRGAVLHQSGDRGGHRRGGVGRLRAARGGRAGGGGPSGHVDGRDRERLSRRIAARGRGAGGAGAPCLGALGRNATPFLYEVSGEHFLAQPELAHESSGRSASWSA
jgi:NADP-dependent aldehyde dehydrogenase